MTSGPWWGLGEPSRGCEIREGLWSRGCLQRPQTKGWGGSSQVKKGKGFAGWRSRLDEGLEAWQAGRVLGTHSALEECMGEAGREPDVSLWPPVPGTELGGDAGI